MAKSVFWGGLVVGLAWTLFRLFSNEGCILDDEFTHYLISRSVWENPQRLLDSWARPGRNFIHIWAASFGLTAARIYTLGLAMVGFWITYRIGKRLNLKSLWALPVLYLFQAWFPELSYPVLTQTPFLLIWILGTWLGMRGNWHLAGVCFGYLSLIRHEGILLTAIWGLWVTCQPGGLVHSLLHKKGTSALVSGLRRDALYGVSTVSAIVVYNLVSKLWVGGKAPFELYFESKPTEIYGDGPIWHYVPLLLGGLGLFSFLLSFVGAWAMRKEWRQWSLLLATYPTYFIMHSLIYWQGAFASGGYYHFLMPMLPFFALLGVKAIDFLGGISAKRRVQRVAILSILILIVYQGFRMDQRQMSSIDWVGLDHDKQPIGFQFMSDSRNFGVIAGPIKMDRRQATVGVASDWVNETYPDRIVFASHIVHPIKRDLLQTKERLDLDWSGPENWPVGTLFIWDEHYSEFHGGMEWESLEKRPNWRMIRAWHRTYPDDSQEGPAGKYLVAVFEKFEEAPDEVGLPDGM